MRTIWKFPLQFKYSQTIRIPTGYVFLSVQMQRDVPTLWAIVNRESIETKAEIICHGTGQDVDKQIDKGRFEYLGTVQPETLVFHFFGELQ